MSLLRLVLGLALAVLLTAPTTATATRGLATCGVGPVFPRAALHGPATAETDGDPAARALREFVRAPTFPGLGGFAPPPGFGATWLRLTNSPSSIVFGHRRGRAGLDWYALAESGEAGWVIGSHGPCVLRRHRPGKELAPFAMSYSAGRRLTLVIETGTCFPGRNAPRRAARRFDHFELRETARSVSVRAVLRPEPPPADGICGGTGVEFRRTVVLRRPLGARVLLDGGAIPAAAVRRITVPAAS